MTSRCSLAYTDNKYFDNAYIRRAVCIPFESPVGGPTGKSERVWTCSHVQCSHVLLTGSEMLMTSSSATLTTNQCSTWLNEMIVVQIFKSLYLKNYLSNLDGVLTTIFVELPSTKLSIWISFLKLISNSSSYLRDDWRLCRFIVPKISLLIVSNTCWSYLARSANLPEGLYILR